MITNDRLGEHTRVAHIYKDIYMAVGLRPWRVAHKYKDIFMAVGLRPWGVSGYSQRLIKETDKPGSALLSSVGSGNRRA